MCVVIVVFMGVEFKITLQLDVVGQCLWPMGTKTIPDEAPPILCSFYHPWVADIDLLQSRNCGFFVPFTDKKRILAYGNVLGRPNALPWWRHIRIATSFLDLAFGSLSDVKQRINIHSFCSFGTNHGITVWIWAGNYISFTIAVGLIRLHMPGVKKYGV